MPEPGSIVPALMAVIADRKANPPSERSYVVKLLNGGTPAIGAKIVEEAAEVGRSTNQARRLPPEALAAY